MFSAVFLFFTSFQRLNCTSMCTWHICSAKRSACIHMHTKFTLQLQLGPWGTRVKGKKECTCSFAMEIARSMLHSRRRRNIARRRVASRDNVYAYARRFTADFENVRHACATKIASGGAAVRFLREAAIYVSNIIRPVLSGNWTLCYEITAFSDSQLITCTASFVAVCLGAGPLYETSCIR